MERGFRPPNLESEPKVFLSAKLTLTSETEIMLCDAARSLSFSGSYTFGCWLGKLGVKGELSGLQFLGSLKADFGSSRVSF